MCSFFPVTIDDMLDKSFNIHCPVESCTKISLDTGFYSGTPSHPTRYHNISEKEFLLSVEKFV